MIEIFADISDNVKKTAEVIWNMAILKSTPLEAATYLNDMTEHYREIWTEEEVDFLRFYFQTRMEMIKNEINNNSIG